MIQGLTAVFQYVNLKGKHGWYTSSTPPLICIIFSCFRSAWTFSLPHSSVTFNNYTSDIRVKDTISYLRGVRFADDDVCSWGYPLLHASHEVPRAACHLGAAVRKHKAELKYFRRVLPGTYQKCHLFCWAVWYDSSEWKWSETREIYLSLGRSSPLLPGASSGPCLPLFLLPRPTPRPPTPLEPPLRSPHRPSPLQQAFPTGVGDALSSSFYLLGPNRERESRTLPPYSIGRRRPPPCRLG